MRVLIAIDGSEGSAAAVAEVARRPWPAESEFRVILVEPPVAPGIGPGAVPGAFDELMKKQQIEAHGHLKAAVDLLTRAGLHGTITSGLLQGLPKETIVQTAEEWGADLIIVGSQGSGPLRRLFLGSVSSFVANNAPCSVAIIRPRSSEAALPVAKS